MAEVSVVKTEEKKKKKEEEEACEWMNKER